MIRPVPNQQAHLPSVPRRPLWAWSMSLLLHAVLLSSLMVYVRQSSLGGDVEEPDRPVGVVLVHALPERTEHHPDRLPHVDVDADAAPANVAPGEASSPQLPSPAHAAGAAPRAAQTSQAAAAPPDFAPPLDLDGILAEMTAAAEPSPRGGPTSGVLGGDGLWDSPGDGAAAAAGDRGLKAAAAGSKGAVSLFGISATGSRFVYVIDRSDSMNRFGGRPWRAAKSELARSLESLTPSQSFQLILYNERPWPYRGGTVSGAPVQMLLGEPEAVARAQRYLQSAEAFGGTNHLDALRMALRMGPDVIFFLTDGHIPSLSDRELSDIRELAQRSGTTIHSIEFDAESAAHPSSFVRHLAAQNGGAYRYFDVRRFSASGGWLGAAEPKP